MREQQLEALRSNASDAQAFASFSLATPHDSPLKEGGSSADNPTTSTLPTSVNLEAVFEEVQQQQETENKDRTQTKEQSTVLEKLLTEVRSLKATVATQQGLEDLRRGLLEDTKKLVETRVKPLEVRLNALPSRLHLNKNYALSRKRKLQDLQELQVPSFFLRLSTQQVSV